jgi:ParB/RepB/Spo0J family partition protein
MATSTPAPAATNNSRPKAFQPVNWQAQKAQIQRQAAVATARLTRILGTDYRLVPLAEIVADSPAQSRANVFDAERDEDDRALAESIRDIGLVQPVVLVRRKSEPGYQIQAGHRRVAAMRYLGLPQIQALVVADDTPELAFVTLAENTRKDLTSVERWQAVEFLRGQGFNADDIAQKTGNTARRIYKLMELGELVPEARALLSGHAVRLTSAVALAKVPADFQTVVAQAIVEHDLSTRQTIALGGHIKARIVESGAQAVDVTAMVADLLLEPGRGAAMAAPVLPADEDAEPAAAASAAAPALQGKEPAAAAKPKPLTEKGAREVLGGYFSGLTPAEVSALATDAAKRRLSDKALRLAGICVASGRQKPAEAVQLAMQAERSPMARHWLALLEAVTEARTLLDDGQAPAETEYLLAFAAQQFGELLKMAAQAKKKK